MSRFSTAAIGAAALIGLFAPMQAAQADPTTLTVNKCSSTLIKSVGKYGSNTGACFGKNAATGVDYQTLNDCFIKMDDKFLNSMAKLDAKWPAPTCLGLVPDQITGQATGDVVFPYDDLQTRPLPPLTPSKCDAAAVKCVGKYMAGITGCYAKAAAKAPGAVDHTCIQKAEDKFSDGVKGCFDKAVAKGDCLQLVGTGEATRTIVDQYLVAMVCLLNPGANPDCP